MMETIWSRALDLLRRHGWRQGPYDSAYRVCLTEALSYSGRGRNYIVVRWGGGHDAVRPGRNYIKEVADHLGLVYGGPGQGLGDARPVVQWNDSPERTFAHVERLLTELHEKELAEKGVLHGAGS